MVSTQQYARVSNSTLVCVYLSHDLYVRYSL